MVKKKDYGNILKFIYLFCKYIFIHCNLLVL